MFDTSDPRFTTTTESTTQPVRSQLIAHLRSQIERGTYLTPRRWELAVSNLMTRELDGE